MAVKKYFANADTTITNAFRSNLTQRGTNANMGESDILETFSIYGQASSGSTELERLLIKFPVGEIISDRAASQLPASGSVNFYLKMTNAPHNETVPRHMTLDIYAVSRSWQEGIGLDMEEYLDVVYPGNIGATWMSASSTEAWTRMGGDYHTEPTYSAYFDRGYENMKVDVTPLVEEWIAGTKENYGFGVHLTASQEAYFAEFYPREAVQFDGAAFLSGTSDTDLENDSTISAWIKQSNNTGTRYVLFWQRSAATSFRRVLQINPGGTAIVYRKMYAGGTTTITTDDPLPLNTWTHITVTDTQKSIDIPSIYINSISASATVTQGAGSALTDVDMFAIGGSRSGVSFNFSGSIDDVASFDKILSPGEITELYNGACPAPIKELSIYENLSNWWVHGDDPRDEINLGTPPTEISIYDRVGDMNLYATGSGGMSIVTGACFGGGGVVGPESDGQLINLNGAQTSYYTKKFFGRGSEFYYKRPVIEACWDSSIKDDRGRVYASSSLLTAAENSHTIYLYNIYGGRLRNIPSIGTGPIFVELFSASFGGASLSQITGGYVSTGIYSASIEEASPMFVGETFYDRWGTAGLGTVFHTGSFKLRSHNAFSYHPSSVKYVSTLTNLQAAYTPADNVRLRVFTRLKNWSPTIYTVANSLIETSIIVSASYEISRVVDDLKVLPYGTGSDNCTMMSYDVSGNYFDLDMGYFEPGYAYGIKIAFYDETSWVEQPYIWKFRVDKLDEH